MATGGDNANGGNGGGKPLVFVSYSKQDRAWKDKHLLPQLRALEHAGRLTVWSDDDIDAGDKWYPKIAQAMADAAVAVCLISAHYLATSFCVKEEIPYLLKRKEEEGLGLVFVLLSPCPWDDFPWISERQMLPRKGLSVAEDYQGRETGVFYAVANRVRELLHDPEFQPLRHDVSPQLLEIVRELKTPVEPIAPAWPALPQDRIAIDRLPVTGAELFGRKDELAFLDKAWASEATNVVSLVAWGGVGKSTLVNKWLDRLRADNYRGAKRVFGWSFYSQGTGERVTSADQFIDEALRFFGDDDPTRLLSPWAKGERLAELVRREKALLVLDGMEPLQDRVQGITDTALSRLVEELAQSCSGLCLITTREKVKELGDFPETTSEKNLEQVSAEAGRALLRVKGVRGTDAELEKASEAFGNHALAINLLANWLREIPGHPIAKANEIPDLDIPLEKGRHPRRVMAAFAKRFGEGSAEIEVLRLLGLFDRPATEGAIDAVRAAPPIPELTDHLSELDDAGWLRLLERLRDVGLTAPKSHHAPEEVDAHPLVREHFGEKLREKYPDAWQAGHARLYEHFKALPEKEQPDTLEKLAPLLQAVSHGCQAGRHQEALNEVYWPRISRGEEHYVTQRLGAPGADLMALVGFFDESWNEPVAGTYGRLLAPVLNHTGYCLRAIGRVGDALAPIEASHDLCVELGDWRRAARVAIQLCAMKEISGDLVGAISYGECAVRHADKSGCKQIRAESRSALATTFRLAGDGLRAERLFDDAESIDAEAATGFMELAGGYRYSELLLDLGRHDDVRKRLVHSESDIRRPITRALYCIVVGQTELMSYMVNCSSDLHKAQYHLDKAVDLFRTLGFLWGLPHGLIARAALFRATSEFERAGQDLDEVLRLSTRSGSAMPLFECDALLEHARLDLALSVQGAKKKHLDQAHRHLERAKEIITRTGYHRRGPDLANLEAQLAAA